MLLVVGWERHREHSLFVVTEIIGFVSQTTKQEVLRLLKHGLSVTVGVWVLLGATPAGFRADRSWSHKWIPAVGSMQEHIHGIFEGWISQEVHLQDALILVQWLSIVRLQIVLKAKIAFDITHPLDGETVLLLECPVHLHELSFRRHLLRARW